MNGLANAILTLLLGWLRLIINRFWDLLNSETGASFLSFLAKHWLTVLLVLVLGSFVLDRIIYFIRWRPYRVWFRRRRHKEDTATPVEDLRHTQMPVAEPPVPEARWEPEPTGIYQPQQAAQTAVYPRPDVDRRAYMPPMDNVEPVFDDAQTAWATADALVTEPEPTRQQPVISDRYMQDVQSGFARPLPPEQLYNPQPAPEPLYTPRPEPVMPQPYPDRAVEAMVPDEQPIHPGLDTDVLRRNMGLAHSAAAEQEPPRPPEPTPAPEPAPKAAHFTPFTHKPAPEEAQKKNRNPFLHLMRLVSDESSKPSIRDLQSTVDVRTAFHDPVFPQQPHEEE